MEKLRSDPAARDPACARFVGILNQAFDLRMDSDQAMDHPGDVVPPLPIGRKRE